MKAWRCLQSLLILAFLGCGSGETKTRPPQDSAGTNTPAGSAGGSGSESGKGGDNTGGSSSGAGGEAELNPVDVNVIQRTKIDMLFMIDNSSSMADKQAILAAAVPALLERLLNPECRDSKTKEVFPRPADGKCPAGAINEFEAPTDLHIGVIDSSLGAFGLPKTCDDEYDKSAKISDPHNNDQARLLSRGVSPTPDGGFLAWKSGDETTKLATDFANMVAGVGQHGCGYEASLESIYRFLVDPDPPAEVKIVTENNRQVASMSGTDEQLLAQRSAFLRPDSFVLVVLFSDEDDCSIRQDGQSWLAVAPYNGANKSVLRPGTSKCAENPNDKCCFNCGQSSQIPEGCPSPADDPACSYQDGGPRSFASSEDPVNLRCWRQKQRYGIDLLYPISRYANGFSQAEVPDRSGKLVPNPLFACTSGDCKLKRDPTSEDGSAVLFAAVVGVPWQDLARDPNDIGKGYKPADELESGKVWPIVLGDPAASPPVPPTDPLMIDQVDPRTASSTGNPLGDSALPAGPDSAAGANPINGHEWDTSKTSPQPKADLQYACVFDLPEGREKDCSGGASDCDCAEYENGPKPADYRNPLCQDSSGAYSTTQRRAKAYPGVRHLQVVKALGSQALAASICPADLKSEPKNPTYGYNPIIDMIVDRAASQLVAR